MCGHGTNPGVVDEKGGKADLAGDGGAVAMRAEAPPKHIASVTAPCMDTALAVGLAGLKLLSRG